MTNLSILNLCIRSKVLAGDVIGRKNGEALGRAGMWNFLWQLAYHLIQCTVNQLPNPHAQSHLFVDKTLPMNSQMVHDLKFKRHEIAFHYNTGKRNWQTLFRRVFSKKTRLFPSCQIQIKLLNIV